MNSLLYKATLANFTDDELIKSLQNSENPEIIELLGRLIEIETKTWGMSRGDIAELRGTISELEDTVYDMEEEIRYLTSENKNLEQELKKYKMGYAQK